MKDFFLKFKNLRYLPISTFAVCFFVSYYWIKIFHFSHPFPKVEFYGVLFLQFCFGCIPNFISRKFGRIFTVAGAMVLVRISSFTHSGFDIPTLNGLFFGSVCGIFLREFVLEFLGRRDLQVSTKETDYFRRLMVLNPPPSSKKNILSDIQFAFIIFLTALTLERFIIYFNAPFIKNFGILETMYLPEISSKTAFALSMKTIDSLIFPLLYFFCEERTSPQMNPPQNHWLLGAAIGLVVNISAIFSQTFYSIKIFSENSNESLIANRTMGLLRDSGSSSWIIPTFLFFFAWRIFSKKGEWRTGTKVSILSGLFLIAILAGIKQGRTYWAIFFITLFIILSILIFRKIQNKILKISFFPITILVFALSIFLLVKAGNKLQSVNSVSRISSNLELLFSKGSDLRTTLSKIDPNRFPLSIIALQVFSKNMFFGNGMGSFILTLYDKSVTSRKNFAMIDSAPSFYLGALSETGLFGTVVIALWLINSLVKKKSGSPALFLILPFLIGYQIVHPDGAFVAIFLILAVSHNAREYGKFETISVILIIGFSAFFIIASLFAVNSEGFGPDFRREKTGVYQLSAYEKNKSDKNRKYHVFKGKTAWSLKNEKMLRVSVFLDNSTSKKSVKQRWSILDANWKEVQRKEVEVLKNSQIIFALDSSKNSKYVQVEELNEKGESLYYGDIPFCIPANQFSKENQFQSLP